MLPYGLLVHRFVKEHVQEVLHETEQNRLTRRVLVEDVEQPQETSAAMEAIARVTASVSAGHGGELN